MKLFKTVDEKLAEIGFTKEKEDKYGCVYKRKDKKYNFTQKVVIGHKKLVDIFCSHMIQI